MYHSERYGSMQQLSKKFGSLVLVCLVVLAPITAYASFYFSISQITSAKSKQIKDIWCETQNLYQANAKHYSNNVIYLFLLAKSNSSIYQMK